LKRNFLNFDFIFPGENRKSFIFPNDYDIIQHQYASPSCSINADNGTIEANNGLCTCAPGFTFVNKTSPCRKIIFHVELFNR